MRKLLVTGTQISQVALISYWLTVLVVFLIQKHVLQKLVLHIATDQSYLFLKQHFSKQDLKKWCIGISKKYFDTLGINKITDNNTFWVNMQPLFPRKRKSANKMTLEDSEENIITDDTLVSEKLNIFFQKCNKNSKY